MQQGKERIYVCHTYYHVYVTCLKELNLPKERRKKATLILSKMSIDFKDLRERMEETGLFEQVLEFDEKREEYFPQLERYKKQGKVFKYVFENLPYKQAGKVGSSIYSSRFQKI